VQLLWCSFDFRASTFFSWSAGEWELRDGQCHTRTTGRDDIRHVRTNTVPLTDVFLMSFSSRYAVQLWLSSSLGPVVVSSVSAI